MFIIGLTGSLATGKSSVADIFKTLGAKVFDADKEVRDLLRNDPACIRQVKSAFKDVVEKNTIDRHALAQIVFSSKAKLKQLENIIHPLVAKRRKAFLAKHKSAKCVVLDVPLLFEVGIYKETDLNIVVKANQTLQVKRAVKRLGITKAEAMRRIKAQMPIARKIQLTDEVIDNRGTKKQLEKQVKSIYLKYIKNNSKVR